MSVLMKHPSLIFATKYITIGKLGYTVLLHWLFLPVLVVSFMAVPDKGSFKFLNLIN